MIDRIDELPVIQIARKANPHYYFHSGQKPQSREEKLAEWLKSKVIEAITDGRFPESEVPIAKNGSQDLEVIEADKTADLS